MPPSPAPDTCWLYLIRHGATENNRAVPPRLQGRRTDPGLSAEGRRQADATGRFLADFGIDRVLASPLLRAQETAQAVAEPLGMEVETVKDLIEVDVGVWEGLDWDEIQRESPDAYRAFMEDASVNPYRGGETISVVLDRAAPALERLMRENVGRSIVVVAHNVVNRAYLTRLLGLELRQYRSVPQDNCAVNVIRWRGQSPKLVTLNAVFHLPWTQRR